MRGIGTHVCEGCGGVYDNLGDYWDCVDSHGAGYDYGEAVNAPLSEATITALAARLASGDYPVRRVSVRAPEGGYTAVPVYPVETRRTAARRRLESIRRSAWEDRVRTWLSFTVSMRSAGADWVEPIAPEGTAEGWRWENWVGYSEHDVLYVALVRTYGCRCMRPLLGWTMPDPDGNGVPTPRCRTCNTEAPDAG